MLLLDSALTAAGTPVSSSSSLTASSPLRARLSSTADSSRTGTSQPAP